MEKFVAHILLLLVFFSIIDFSPDKFDFCPQKYNELVKPEGIEPLSSS